MATVHTARSGASGGLDRLELEHVMGFSPISSSLKILRGSPDVLVHPIGPILVLTDMTDMGNQQLLIGHDNDVSAIAVSPSSRQIASGQMGVGPTKDAPLLLWDAVSRIEQLRLLGHTGVITAVAFSPDSRLIASADDTGRYVWDATSGAVVSGARVDPPAACVSLCLSTRRARVRPHTRSRHWAGL